MTQSHQTTRPVLTRAFALAAPLALLSACDQGAGEAAPATAPATAPGSAAESPQDAFFAALSTHCGKAYAGGLVSEDAADADFAEAEMVMHVDECSDERITVPFHVQVDGEWDRSRTWIITRTSVPHMSGTGETPLGLRLKHDHRHEDGVSDDVTMYGGDTADEGTARAQNFPVDQFSIDMFEASDLGASVTNVWTVEVDPAGTQGGKYVYQLKRTIEGGAPEDRLFRVEFDLSQEVEAPPPAWGWE